MCKSGRCSYSCTHVHNVDVSFRHCRSVLFGTGPCEGEEIFETTSSDPCPSCANGLPTAEVREGLDGIVSEPENYTYPTSRNYDSVTEQAEPGRSNANARSGTNAPPARLSQAGLTSGYSPRPDSSNGSTVARNMPSQDNASHGSQRRR